MVSRTRFHWVRVVLAVLVAEAVPILALVLVVVVYGMTRRPESPTPEEFAPRAGNWVGPIGGFLATWLCAWWVAKRASNRPLLHGMAVGAGAALVDVGLATLIGGGDDAPVHPILYLSNVGRLLAGALGGWLASRVSHSGIE
jgi:hypothetical protein